MQGDAGTDGEDGSRTIAYVADDFIMPLVNSGAVLIDIRDDLEGSGVGWIAPGMLLFIEGAGYMNVVSVDPSGPSVTVGNPGYAGNAVAGATITVDSSDPPLVVPAAPRGSDAPAQSRGFVLLEQIEDQGTAGGTFTTGAYRPRLLNTKTTDTGGYIVNLDAATGIFTLKAGFIYEFEAGSPAFDVLKHKARVRNVDNSDVYGGTSEYSSASGGQTESLVMGRFSLSGDTQFVLEHRCSQTQATNGMGVASDFNDGALGSSQERFAWIKIWAVPVS